MAQLQVASDSRTAKVEITVFHTDIVTSVGIVLYLEGRCLAVAENLEHGNKNLDIACLHLRVLALPLADLTYHLYAVFPAQLVGSLAKGCIISLVEHQLCDAVTVAQVDKRHTAHLTYSLYPSGQSNLFAGIGESKLPACV